MTKNELENEGIASLIMNGTSVTKAFRVFARLTVDQAAEASGLNRMRLLEIEGGSKPSVDEVRRISAAIEKSRVWGNM